MSGIVWWEIVTPDPDRFQAFHGALWGWTFTRAFEGPESELDADYWLIAANDKVLGGLQRAAAGQGQQTGGTRLYVEVDDLEATFEDVVDAGGRVERARTALGAEDRWFGTILDPTGLSLGIWTANQPR